MSHFFVDTTKKPGDENVVYHNTSLGIVDASKISLCWSNLQFRGPRNPWQEDGIRIYEDMRRKSLNSNILDYLLAHQYLIPNKWENRKYWVIFWGTVYYFKDNNQKYVKCLRFNKVLNKWQVLPHLIDDYFGPDCPAACPRLSWQEVLRSGKYNDFRWFIAVSVSFILFVLIAILVKLISW